MWNYNPKKINNSVNGGRKCEECNSAEFEIYRSTMYCAHCGLVVEKNR